MLDLWYKALASPFGIEVACSDARAARIRLYTIRREIQDSDLDDISIHGSPFDPNKLWLVKKRRPTDETP